MLPHCERFAATNIPFARIGRSTPKYHGAERVDVAALTGKAAILAAEWWGEPSLWYNALPALCRDGLFDDDL